MFNERPFVIIGLLALFPALASLWSTLARSSIDPASRIVAYVVIAANFVFFALVMVYTFFSDMHYSGKRVVLSVLFAPYLLVNLAKAITLPYAHALVDMGNIVTIIIAYVILFRHD